jgi:hypothetical protein
MSLASWCRWKALYYKGNKSLSASLEEESVYIKTLPNYVRKWIVDGEGSAHADINNDVIIRAALDWMIEDKGKQQTIKIITSNCDDFKLFADYCFNLEQ